VQQLIDVILEGFRAAGGDFNAGRKLASLIRGLGVEPRLDAIVGKSALDDTIRRAELELGRAETWGITFTLIQAYASVP
jgi:hypothetical protein